MRQIHAFLTCFLPGLYDGIIFELGAHVGKDTCTLLSLLRPPYRYYAFEPDARAVAKLVEFSSYNPNITVERVAASDVDGSIDFYASYTRILDAEEYGYGSSLKEPLQIFQKYPWIQFKKDKSASRAAGCLCLGFRSA